MTLRLNPRRKTERNREILEAVLSGASLTSIARKYGVGPSRISQLARHIELPKRSTIQSRTAPQPIDPAAYEAYRRSPQWKELRRRVFERDGGKCAQCSGAEILHAHHVTYERVFREELEDLLTLCRGCHVRLHGLEG